jgi:hypothetical protein
MSTRHDNDQEISQELQMPPNMKNIDPNMIRKQMNEIMSDPDKFVKATKKFPMINQFFSKIPFEGKKRIANLFKRSDLINELPTEIIYSKDLI